MEKPKKSINQSDVNRSSIKRKSPKKSEAAVVKQNVAIAVIVFFVAVIVYFTIVIVNFLEKPTDTVLIKRGEVIRHEEVVGYVIRNEELIDTSSFDGIIKSEVDDATRVAKGSEVITYVSKSEQQLIDKIEKLDEKIDKAIESQQTIFPNDVKILESEIESNIYTNIKGNIDLELLRENKKTLNEKVMKKAKIVGELSPAGSELKSLITERAGYEAEINDSQKVLLAPSSGLISYRVDGLENVLTYDSLSKLTSKNLSNMKLVLNQVVPLTQNKVKVINNFECYIAASMDSEESKKAMLNDTVYLRFKDEYDTRVPATIEYISDEEDGTLLVFKVKTNVEELTKYRKIGVDVIWWSSTGLKLNKDAIFYTTLDINDSGDEGASSGELIVSGESGESVSLGIEVGNSGENLNAVSGETSKKQVKIETIRIKKAYSSVDVFVKILKETDEFVIIDNYKDTELIEMGIDEEVLKNRPTMKMYDEVLMVESTE